MEPMFAWTNEPLKKLPRNNFFYFLFCLLTFRPRKKMTYKEMYLIISEINRKTLGKREAEKLAFQRIIDFYVFNNGEKPKDIQ
jgi:hypothetical protein